VLHPTLHVLVPRSRRQEKQGQQRQKDEREAAKAPRKRGGQGERDGRGRAHRLTNKTAKKHILENMQLSDRILLVLYTSIFSTYSNTIYTTYIGLLPLTVIHINLLYVFEYHTIRILCIFRHVEISKNTFFKRFFFK
jgi:hypothetical protein